MDAPFLLYGVGLAAAAAAASLTVTRYPDRALARATVALFVNWLVGTAFAQLTGITDGWWFNIPLDLVTAAAIFYHLRGRWQVALALTYCVQIAMHGYYGWMSARGVGLPWPYYGGLTAIAWLQLLLVLGWSGEIWLQRAIARRQAGSAGGRG